MSLRFDATLKDLAQVSPRGILAAFDSPPPLPISLLNVDLSTVTTTADVVFGLGEPLQEIVHLDFQSSASATKHAEILVYNALLHRLYRVPVHSMAILLRPEAAHANMNGVVAYAPRARRGKMDYQYELVRIWERPAVEFLSGDLGATPLAVLGQFPAGVELEAGLAGVLHRLIDRLRKEAAPDQSRRLLASAYLLTGLRVDQPTAENLFQGVHTMTMEDSSTFMAILDEGSIREARKLILRFGQKSLGQPGDDVKATLAGIKDLDRLEALLDRISAVKSWHELLAMS